MADEDILKFPMKKKREPKVLVFEEPKKTRQVKRSKKPLTPADLRMKRKLANLEDDDTDFNNVAREVKEFGVTGFSKKEQKRDKQSYAESLGARKQKNLKVPYPMLMERRKRQREKADKEREMERSMGIFKKKDKGDSDNITKKLNLGHWVDKSNSVGKLTKRDVSMHIKKSEILKVQRSKQ